MAIIRFGNFAFDSDHSLLLRDGEPVVINHKCLLLLTRLVEGAGQTVTKQELLDYAWPGLSVEENNLSVQIAALRRLLGSGPSGESWIVTIPRIGYRFIRSPMAGGESIAEPAKRPSILVLPFANASGEAGQDYLADGITEDIIIALARYRWFSVIPWPSSLHLQRLRPDPVTLAADHAVSHVVEGTLRKEGCRIRVTARLSAIPAGTHVWGERYEVEMGDAFAIQDDIAERVAGALEPELLRVPPPVLHHTGNITAWDLVRQGTYRFHRLRPETHLAARELFRQAARLDPELGEAQLWISRVNAGLVAYGWSENPEGDLAEGRQAGRRAVELDERNPYAHYGLAIASAYSCHFAEAIQAAERAIEIAPSFALGHLVLGMARLFSGNAMAAVRSLEQGLRLSPYDPQNFVWCDLLALSYLFGGSPIKAREFGEKSLQIRPAWRTTLEILAACAVALQDGTQAEVCRREYHSAPPTKGDVLSPLRRFNKQWAKILQEAVGASSDGDAAYR